MIGDRKTRYHTKFDLLEDDNSLEKSGMNRMIIEMYENGDKEAKNARG